MFFNNSLNYFFKLVGIFFESQEKLIAAYEEEVKNPHTSSADKED